MKKKLFSFLIYDLLYNIFFKESLLLKMCDFSIYILVLYIYGLK